MSATTFHHAVTSPLSRAPNLAWLVLGILAVVILSGLILPLRAPIGAMYWDSFLYLDAAHRIAGGQVPNIDFFTPVGPLEYYLSSWTLALFPNAQPMYAANWSIAIITIPAMALIVSDLGRRAPFIALAITLPFAIFTLLPFNTTEYYS